MHKKRYPHKLARLCAIVHETEAQLNSLVRHVKKVQKAPGSERLNGLNSVSASQTTVPDSRTNKMGRLAGGLFFTFVLSYHD